MNSSDEKPKAEIAKQVITPKQIYFVPRYNVAVEAENASEAVKLAKKAVKTEDGDAE